MNFFSPIFFTTVSGFSLVLVSLITGFLMVVLNFVNLWCFWNSSDGGFLVEFFIMLI